MNDFFWDDVYAREEHRKDLQDQQWAKDLEQQASDDLFRKSEEDSH